MVSVFLWYLVPYLNDFYVINVVNLSFANRCSTKVPLQSCNNIVSYDNYYK